MKLRLAEKLSLPLDAATETFAILGRRGSGKTHTAVVMAEEMLDAGVQVVVIDPLDVWWGLRVSKDGKAAGIPIYVAGGTHQDIPLLADAGRVMADVVVDKGLSVVLSLRHLSKSDQRRFVGDFGERLYDRKGEDKHRTALHVFIDEADAFVPQRLMPGSERCFGAIDTLVRRGRSSGIAPTLISQRPQVINKDVLSQTEVLVAHQLTGPQDRKALEAWIEAHDTENQRAAFMESLASLAKGTAWFWSPGMLDIFRKVAVRDRRTFDSSSTPKPGAATAKPKAFAPVDLQALTTEIQATIEKAKADDPRELRKRIAELEKQLKSEVQTAKSQATSPKVVEKPVVTDAQIARIEKLVERFDQALMNAMQRHNGVAEQLQQLVSGVHAVRRANANVQPGGLHEGRAAAGAPRQLARSGVAERPLVPEARRHADVRPRASAADAAGSNGHLPTGERATLIAAAQYPAGITREQASILTGYKRSSRDAYIQRLVSRGYLEVAGGQVIATEGGVAALGADFELLPTGEALQEYWLRRLPAGEAAVLERTIAVYPRALDRDALSDATGYKRSSRDAYIQRLQARQLLERGGGLVTASAVLFERPSALSP